MTLYNSWLANPALRNPDYSDYWNGGRKPFLHRPMGPWGLLKPFGGGRPMTREEMIEATKTGPWWRNPTPFGGGRPMTREEWIDVTKMRNWDGLQAWDDVQANTAQNDPASEVSENNSPWNPLFTDPRFNPSSGNDQENAQPIASTKQPKATGAWKNSPLGHAYKYGIKPMLDRLQQAGKPAQQQPQPWVDSPFNRAWKYGINPLISAMQNSYNARFPQQMMQNAVGRVINSIPFARQVAVNDFVRNNWNVPPKPEAGEGGPSEYAQ